MKILAFAGSNSRNSINHALVTHVAELGKDMGIDIEVIRLTDFDTPMYGIDLQNEHGFPEPTLKLAQKIDEADKLIISLAEHNGSPTAFFKNQIDWLSRHNVNFLEGKQVLLLSTAPGPVGGANALAITKTMLPFFSGEVVGEYSLGRYDDRFVDGKPTDDTVDAELKAKLQALIAS